MAVYRSITKLIMLLTLGGLLAACDTGGGSDTIANPNLGNNSNVYNGPPAQTSDTRAFQLHFWQFLKESNRCGQCHGAGQDPTFVSTANINDAYAQALPNADFQNPGQSEFVVRVRGGHNCWLTDNNACGDIVEQMIVNWGSNSNLTSARLIQLVAPPNKLPGQTRSFPADPNAGGANSFFNTVYQVLIGAAAGTQTPAPDTNNCQRCHVEVGPALPQAPFFASGDVVAAYAAARSKINIDTPNNSRFIERLDEGHNCWPPDCPSSSATMLSAITQFANGIPLNNVDPALLTSRALNLTDGIVASGGSRHEINQVALWEFKEGDPSPTAFDTSGIEPAADLTLSGSVTWMSNYGLQFTGGRAQAIDSSKIHAYIQSSGEYAIEAWVVPSNVAQTNANIVGFSGGNAERNFTLGQDMYNYDFYNRIDSPDPQAVNGEPFLSSGANDEEIAQAGLQHVVLNYDPINGRSIYVNGALVDVSDPVAGQTSINNVWNDTYAFVIGNEIAGGNRPWAGQLRMVALHNRVLTPSQVQQNFDVGVGENYYLLFGIGHFAGVHPDSYIMFEVAQYDNYSYLFKNPTFVNLDSGWVQTSIDIKGLRIAINGKEAAAGQAYANLDATIDGSYDPVFGQQLSSLGTIIALDKGPISDEFFLTFESIGTETPNPYTEALPAIPGDPIDPANPISSDIGVRTFEEINSAIASITGVRVTNSAVDGVYDDYIQQLPTIEAIDAFLPSHQMAIAQLALTSCNELVENRGSITRGVFFPGFDFSNTNPAQTAFDTPAERAQIIDPLLAAVMNVDQGDPTNDLTTQPDVTGISDMLGSSAQQHLDDPTPASGDEYDSLITDMLLTGANTAVRTRQIVKAVCAAAVGGGVMLVQ